jgi:hypothetical protein
MGRNDQRQTAKLPFKGKAVEVYRPTDGQAAVIFLAAQGKGDNSKAVSRFFQVLENLVVKSSDWDRMEDLMISGDALVKDFSDFFQSVYSYEWSDEATPDAK